MKMYGKAEVNSNVFLTLALGGGKGSAVRSSRFMPPTHYTEGYGRAPEPVWCR